MIQSNTIHKSGYNFMYFQKNNFELPGLCSGDCGRGGENNGMERVEVGEKTPLDVILQVRKHANHSPAFRGSTQIRGGTIESCAEKNGGGVGAGFQLRMLCE